MADHLSSEHPVRRVAVVTGAAQGIGAAVAARLARDGLAVALVDVNGPRAQAAAALIREGGGEVVAVVADISDPADVERAFGEVVGALGPPVVLVNNAGVTRDALVFKMTDDEWDTVIDVHLKGAFLMTRACQSFMVQAGWGRVVTLSSVAALGNRGQLNYATAKAGLQGFTKTLAIELGKFGVTANAIAPGFIVTEMTRSTAERVGQPWEKFIRANLPDIPAGRVGEPEDIANAVAFFVDERSGFVNGQVLYVAGGPRA